jgi:hypothetical protein
MSALAPRCDRDANALHLRRFFNAARNVALGPFKQTLFGFTPTPQLSRVPISDSVDAASPLYEFDERSWRPISTGRIPQRARVLTHHFLVEFVVASCANYGREQLGIFSSGEARNSYS